MIGENQNDIRIDKTLPERIALTEVPIGGVGEASKFFLWILRRVIEKYATLSKEWDHDFSLTRNSERKSPPSEALFNLSLSKLSSDYHSRISAAPFVKFFEEPDAQSYVVRKDFWSTFKDVRLGRLSYFHLPDSFSGHVELPEAIMDLDGNSFRDVFVHVGSLEDIEGLVPGEARGTFRYEHEGRAAVFGYLDEKTGRMGYLLRPYPKDSSMLVSESIVGGGLARLKAGESDEEWEVEYEAIKDYPDHARILFNLLMYLHSGNPDLRPMRMTPRLRGGPGSSPVNKDKDLSQKEVVIVGYSYKKPPRYTVGRWEVRMHERLIQGKDGRPRLVFVEAHERSRRSQTSDNKTVD